MPLPFQTSLMHGMSTELLLNQNKGPIYPATPKLAPPFNPYSLQKHTTYPKVCSGTEYVIIHTILHLYTLANLEGICSTQGGSMCQGPWVGIKSILRQVASFRGRCTCLVKYWSYKTLSIPSDFSLYDITCRMGASLARTPSTKARCQTRVDARLLPYNRLVVDYIGIQV